MKPGDTLRLTEVAKPVPKPGEVLIKVAATGLNRADLLQKKGQYPPPPGTTNIIGLECAGTIEQGAGQYKEGDKVMALLSGGGYAQYVSVDSGLCLPIPTNLSLEEAAAIPEAWITAYMLLFRIGKATPHTSVLARAAASGVGTALVQLTKAHGIELCALSRTAAKLATLQTLGATQVATEVPEQEFDVILDPVAGITMNENIDRLKKDGRIVVYGLMGGSKGKDLNFSKLLVKRGSILFTVLRSRSLDYRTGLVAEFGNASLDLFNNGTLRPVIDKVGSWEEVEALHKHMEDNKSLGKIIMKIK